MTNDPFAYPNNVPYWLVQCPFCERWHPDDELCGCEKEEAHHRELMGRAETGDELSDEETETLTTYEMLS